MRALFVLGRTILGGFFAYNGINHLQNSKGLGQYAAAKGVPQPELAVQATGALLLAGGLSIAAGLKPRQGLAAVVAFLIPVSLQMHRFWEEQDAQKRQTEMINFTKNMALVGAALALMELPEPWPASIDAARAADEEMYIRLGGRELRALPA
jgi:putative oxidoreductase